MAYMSQDKKKELAPKIKEICKRHGVKATIGVRHYSTLVLNVNSGVIDFGEDDSRCGRSINTYHYEEHYEDNPIALAFLSEVVPCMMIGNHDNSDIMTDYFDVGWYIDVNVGRWNKPYILTKENK